MVIVWAINSPKGEGAASLEFIKRNRLSEYLGKKEQKRDPEEYRLASIMHRYGFIHFDEFDQIISEDVMNGFFDDNKVREGAEKYLKDAERARAEAALEEAWGPYHASFDDNAAEVSRAMFEGSRDNIKYMSAGNLSAAVMILKDIGYPNLASQLISEFVKSRDEGYVFDKGLWGHMVSDPDVIEAVELLSANNRKPSPTPSQAAEMLYKDNWSSEAEEVLEKLSIDDIVSLIKSVRGKEQEMIVMGLLAYRRVINKSDRQKNITENAVAALVKIGNESALNAHRMAKYGVKVEFAREVPDA